MINIFHQVTCPYCMSSWWRATPGNEIVDVDDSIETIVSHAGPRVDITMRRSNTTVLQLSHYCEAITFNNDGQTDNDFWDHYE